MFNTLDVSQVDTLLLNDVALLNNFYKYSNTRRYEIQRMHDIYIYIHIYGINTKRYTNYHLLTSISVTLDTSQDDKSLLNASAL